MQLADLEGHDAPLAVGENRERENGVHAECRNGDQSVLFADQYRIIDAHFACVVLYRITEVNSDTDYFQTVRGAFMTQALQQRDLTAAGGAPGSPEVDEKGAALPLRQVVLDSVRIGQRDLGDIGGD